ncbi:tyrosine-type recombinase/integrase [Paenarthrobacter aromaticivorans]|uniref:tyrosine-type recombinase/integrase n=1 Tax=Paenarthrobacter aromaticivorans TaxID=2849150 RepID=UPI003A812E6E
MTAPFSGCGRIAGLPEELTLHTLRHSYVTHLIEAGYDPLFIQQQVGHSYSSTTALYTSVSADFKQKTIQKMIAQRLRTGGTDEENGHG